jgi:hypothetical protein
VITAKQLPHTFLFARSYRLLEENYDKEHAKAAAHHALVASGGSRPPAPSQGDGGSGSNSGGTPTAPKPPAAAHGAPPRYDNRRSRGRGRGCGAPPGGPNSSTTRPLTAWTPGLNPWTGMVQAWPMPFRVPSAGVLGPRPGQSPQQAYFAGQPSFSPGVAQPPPPMDPWNYQALLAVLNAANSMATAPQTAEWYLDTGVSSHMSSNAGNLSHPTPVPHTLPIIVATAPRCR